MECTPDGLARQLANSAESDFVRITASWLSRTPEWNPEPLTTGNEKIDALVAAAAAHAAIQADQTPPKWTARKALSTFWHPGLPAMFAWSFAHTPIAFKQRGIVIERDSLQCI